MEELFLQAAQSNSPTEKSEIIREITNTPSEALTTALMILNTPQKSLWEIAIQVIDAIGYPQNSAAIFPLIDQLSDPNWPGWNEAVKVLDHIGPDVIAPFIIQESANYSFENNLWINKFEGICMMLCNASREFPLRCGPYLAYLLSIRDSLPSFEISSVVSVFQVVGNDCAFYCLPVLVDLMKSEITDEIYQQIQELISSFEREQLAPYVNILPL